MFPWLDLIIISGGLHFLHLLCLIHLDVVHVDEFSLVVLDQLLHRSASVASTLGVGVSGDSHDSGTTQLGESLVLELLGDGPRDEIT